jgi:hypothetical protein
MELSNYEEIQKAQKQVEIFNGKFVKNAIKQKEQRHVKEENEPVLDEIMSEFQSNYAKKVVGKSMTDILKFLKENV